MKSRQHLLQGGASGLPAVVPGKPGQSYLFELVTSKADQQHMPPKGDRLNAEEGVNSDGEGQGDPLTGGTSK